MKPETLGIHQGRLAACPDSPNCVSSDASETTHLVEPYRLKAAPQKAWELLQRIVASLPRTEVVSVTADYLHAQSRSLLFRFVDDIEFQLRADEQLIAVRSASRIGYYDWGVNRRRVERIRELLRAHGATE
jgi:uncharacterized protein (DUF1499 family)